MACLKLYCQPYWWLPEARFKPDQHACEFNFNGDPGTGRETVPVAIVKSIIYEKFRLTEPSAIVVWPWDRSKGPVPDDASVEDFLNGRYGDISPEKPLQFLLLGAWTFDMTLELEELQYMIEICAHPAPETLGLPREPVEEAPPLVAEQRPNSDALDTATLPESSSAGPVGNTEELDELPQYTAVDESSNPVGVHRLVMERTAIGNSDLDMPPPYTELPLTLDASLPTGMNEVPPSTGNGQHDNDLISLQSQDLVIGRQILAEQHDIQETLDILDALSTTEIPPQHDTNEFVVETLRAPDQIQAPTNLESLQTDFATSEISRQPETIHDLYNRKYRCTGVNLPGAYPSD